MLDGNVDNRMCPDQRKYDQPHTIEQKIE